MSGEYVDSSIAHAPNFVPTLHHDTYPAIDPTKADLSGKYVLISGASRGIGLSIAVALAQAGASGLALLARSSTAATEAAVRAAQRPGSELKILSLSVDTTDPDQATAAVARISESFGRLDIVINNAAMCDPMTSLLADSDANEWWRIWEVNVRGTYNVTKTALPLMLQCGGDKTVVNIVSDAAHWTLPTMSAYCISKLAVLRFTEQLVTEYGNQGLVALAVHPCSTPTEMNSVLPPVVQEHLIDTPELPAHTIVWLLKERREWLSGRFVSCLWDVDEVFAKKDEIVAGEKLKIRMVV